MSTEIASRVLPQNLDAERSLLGAVLLDNDALLPIVEIVGSDDFSREGHRRIFHAIQNLQRRASAVDMVTLAEELATLGFLDKVGGVTYLGTLTEGLPRGQNVEHYARIVKEKSILRQLIRAAEGIQETAYRGAGEVDEIVTTAERQIFEIAEKKLRSNFTALSDLVTQAADTLAELYRRRELVTGLATGFKELDEMTTGFHGAELIIIAARPSVGKTSFCLGLAQHAAIKDDRVAAVFSLEMSKEQIAIRMICCEARVDLKRLRAGYLSQEEIGRIGNAITLLSRARIFVDDSSSITPLEIRSKARRLKAEHGLDLIVIDYLQLISEPGHENRNLEVSAISRSLKALAKELNVPVVALSQLSRAPEGRKDRRPELSDLRECVVGETLVCLADGRRVPVRELVGTTPEVLAVDERERLVTARSDRVWSVGVRPVFEMRLASGRTLEATAEHRVYAARGWTTMGSLRVGDRIAIARRLPDVSSPPAGTWDGARLGLLAHLIGDGSTLSGQPMRYTTASEENSSFVTRGAEALGSSVTRHAGRGAWHQLVISGNGDRWHHKGVGRWLRQLGVFDRRSHEKLVPGEIFQLRNEQIGTFLRHLWATDGCISTGRSLRATPRVFLATCSPRLASDVAALLLRLGIVARTRRVRQASARPLYSVDVSGCAHQRRFLDEVGAFGPRVPCAAKLAERLATTRENPNVDTLPSEVFVDVRRKMVSRCISQRGMAAMRGTAYGGAAHFDFSPSRRVLADYARILEDDELRAKAESDLFWDRVVEIRPGGEQEVFDLTVPGPACWLADGIVSHNSGSIEQDADVVAFLVREEMFDPNAEQGVAELLLKKQRNGPTGTIKLAFIKEYTRFENLEWKPPE